MIYRLVFLVLLVFSLASCKKKQEQESGTLRLRFVHQGNGKDLKLFADRYTNASGDAFTVEAFKYYVSNIRLRNTQTGNLFYEPESYHLVSTDRDKHLFEFDIKNVPTGSFNEIEFAVGVDNAHNSSTDRIGDLNPNGDMAWNWTQGYKFLLFEGKYYPDNQPQGAPLVFHIGDNHNYRIIRFNLKDFTPASLGIANGKTITVELIAEVTGLFNAPQKVDFKTFNQAMGGTAATKIADNYAQGLFRVGSVK